MNKLEISVLAALSTPAYFENDNAALIPEFWAMESMLQLAKMNVYPQLVYRDYDNVLAYQGQVVNAHRPAEFLLQRKVDTDDVVTQDAKAETVPVVLNQHLYSSFVIRDGEESKAMVDLISLYLEPAIRSIAEGLDKMIAAQVYKFTANTVGKLGVEPVAKTLALVKAAMTNQRIPAAERATVLTSNAEASLVGLDLFVGAQTVGDDGTALREGSLGRKYGSQHIVDIAQPSLVGQTAGLTKTVDFTAGYPKGYTGAIVLDTGTLHGVYSVVTINGTVYKVTASAATSVTLAEPLREALADGTAIYQVLAGTIGGNYAVGYSKNVIITDIRGVVGEAIRDATGNVYTIIQKEVDGSFLLDLPLVTAFTTNQKVGVFPDGDYNFAFHKNAIALVTRPLAAPASGTGALSAVVDSDGIALRVVITYDPKAQGHRVTIDLLAGVTVLDTRLGLVLLS